MHGYLIEGWLEWNRYRRLPAARAGAQHNLQRPPRSNGRLKFFWHSSAFFRRCEAFLRCETGLSLKSPGETTSCHRHSPGRVAFPLPAGPQPSPGAAAPNH
ncbi:hypothetical protein LHGZ1_3462 [Laribacter hongkongensis]|uniref:Uncharacterized protein n=1 Tax=Laribacter hongkongensis TaxID=168471 RepID=A0A248LQE4_9NEIS|nr:hypothetical protein LHGZ1_3462 [Laribacter hongkongensis]